MRALLLIPLLVCACTVVPTPSSTATSSGHPQIVGSWAARAAWYPDTLVERLAVFDDGAYSRWAYDSSTATGQRLVLTEQGFWSLSSLDTTRLVLAPASRLVWPPSGVALSAATLVPDTATWSSGEDSLALVLRRFWQRDTFETVAFRRD